MGSEFRQWSEWIWGGDLPSASIRWEQIAARTALVYLVGLALVRLGKSRILSRATPLDVVVVFFLGSVLSRTINGTAALSTSIAAAATLVLLHWSFTRLAFHSHFWGQLIKGRIYVLVRDGQVIQDNLRRAHISEHDLRQYIRLQAHVEDVDQVRLAIKERSGEISIIKRQQKPQVMRIEVAEGVQTVHIVLHDEYHDDDATGDRTRPQGRRWQELCELSKEDCL